MAGILYADDPSGGRAQNLVSFRADCNAAAQNRLCKNGVVNLADGHDKPCLYRQQAAVTASFFLLEKHWSLLISKYI